MSGPKLRPLRAVTFDCWATLLLEADWTTAHGLRVEALVAAAHESGRALEQADATRVFDAAWARHMTLWREGVATGAREIAEWALEELELSDQPTLAHLVEQFEEASHSGRVVPLPGAGETLLRLQRSGIRCGLVCDTGLTPGRVVRKHLDRLGLLTCLDALAFSDEVGEPKPSARIFHAALDQLGASASDTAHVGDLRATDVAGASRLGMATVRIRAHHDDTTAGPEADFVVDDHEALASLLLGAGRSDA